MAFDERHPQYTNSSRVYAGVGTEKQTDGVRRTPSDSEILPRVYAGTGEEKQTDGVRRTPRKAKHERSPQYRHYPRIAISENKVYYIEVLIFSDFIHKLEQVISKNK